MGDNELTSDLIDEGKELIRRGESHDVTRHMTKCVVSQLTCVGSDYIFLLVVANCFGQRNENNKELRMERTDEE